MHIEGIFASLVFDDKAMKRYLSPKTYRQFKKCTSSNLPIPLATINAVAKGMKRWALKRGATHYTHWFQPLTGATCEKHEAFISPKKSGVTASLTGENLLKGEPDASSLPSGGLCSTFRARGYTAWDPTSPAFVKDNILYIPATFHSYGGDSLDKKTPLLRSIQAINEQCVRLLAILGKKVDHIDIEVGAEQEYFLIDSDIFAKRKDLCYTGRTLFGVAAPKGQELCDHYFSAISPRVAKYMQELDEELWKHGILAKTNHNESAPSQHELAPVFTNVNLAVDQNQLTMELMQKVAKRHNLTCLLHEKPFEGLNGSGKHNNWSISTKHGNLFDMGKNPKNNMQFLLMLCAMISAVDTHQDLLRVAVVGASNDLRLGSSEAPPSIISIFLGDELTDILQAIAQDRTPPSIEKNKIKIGINTQFSIDFSDRNRTSPIAFTGNKFEFRMCGSSQSIASINTIINTILSEQFEKFADILEGAKDINQGIKNIIKQTMHAHGRIIFNGNNYSPQWQMQAEKRGLLNLKSSVDALSHMTDKKNVELFKKQGVLSFAELKSRQNVYIEDYCKHVKIEAKTMLEIGQKDMLPAALKYKNEIANYAKNCDALGVDNAQELQLCRTLSNLINSIVEACDKLSSALLEVKTSECNLSTARFYHDSVIPIMEQLRKTCDELEKLAPTAYQSMPSYGEILFSTD